MNRTAFAVIPVTLAVIASLTAAVSQTYLLGEAERQRAEAERQRAEALKDLDEELAVIQQQRATIRAQSITIDTQDGTVRKCLALTQQINAMYGRRR